MNAPNPTAAKPQNVPVGNQPVAPAKPQPAEIVVEKVETAQEAPAVSPELAAKKAAKKEKWNNAKAVLRKYAKDAKTPTDLAEAIKIIVGSGERAIPAAGSGVLGKLREFFDAAKDGIVDEMDLFKEFKIGRGEMRGKARDLVREPKNADERRWVEFDEQKEVWKLVGKGAATPAGWTGVLPGEK